MVMVDRKTEMVEQWFSQSFPKLLKAQYDSNSKKICMRKKWYGIWKEYTWADCYTNIKYLALGLKELGLVGGETVCIMGDNNPEWFWGELAVNTLRGVVVGVHIDATPREVEFYFNHSDATFAIAKDQEQVDKFLQIRDKIPKIKKVVYWDPKGMWAYKDNPLLIQFDEVMKIGEKVDEECPGLFEKYIEETDAEAVSNICYTSGTTGEPKGALVSYRSCLRAIQVWNALQGIPEKGEYVSFVPLSWVVEYMMGFPSWLLYGTVVNFPEEPETVEQDMREIGPTLMLVGTMIAGALQARVAVNIADTSVIKRWLYKISLMIGYKRAQFIVDQQRQPPLWCRFLVGLADLACLKAIRDHMGMSRAKLVQLGGSVTSPDLVRWFAAIGINLTEYYASTEVGTVSLFSSAEGIRLGSSGSVAPGVEVRISNDGEIRVRNKFMFKGYYKAPDLTARAMDGTWFKTGDAGTVRGDGNVIIYDRVSDMIELGEGNKYSPTFIENYLKFSPYVKECVAVLCTEGKHSSRKVINIIVNIDFDNIAKWAEKKRIAYTTLVDLSQRPEVHELVHAEIERVNSFLALEAQIRKFTVLHKEFDADEAEITRTRKLRRDFLHKKYHSLIEAMSHNISEIPVETEVKYRDGRKGIISIALAIRDV
jgi:long-chain acyl-CoA synthetase